MGIKTGWFLFGSAVIAGLVAGLALETRRRVRRSERANPPLGRFLEIDGVRLHYLDVGRGAPLVLLHGDGSLIQDFAASGLLEAASARYRTIVFDRPGCGYSSRPSGRVWTPRMQADLLLKALKRLGVEQPIVVGVSWGALVAASLGLDHPRDVRAVVLVAGYLYASFRIGALLLAPMAIPKLGTAIAAVVSPLLGPWVVPAAARRLFAPQLPPPSFERFPVRLALRPSQVRSAAAEILLMDVAAFNLSKRYRSLEVPVAVVAGTDDRLVDTARHSARLCREVPWAWCRLVPGVGHMMHYEPRHVLAAIEAAEMAAQRVCDPGRVSST